LICKGTKTNIRTNERTNKQTNRQTNKRTHRGTQTNAHTHTHTQTHKHTHTQTDGRTDGQTNRQIDRQAGRQTHIHVRIRIRIRIHTHVVRVHIPTFPGACRYKILRSLGFGTYGKVVECWDRQARAYCAVKVVRAVPKYRHAAKTEVGYLTCRCFRIFLMLTRRFTYLVQVNILMALQGDHRCVRLLRSFDYRGHICLVFELLGPNLYEVMRANSFKPFSVSEIRILARQVLESLAHTHAKGVVHTDVKPENVLFEELLHKRRNSHALAQGGRLQVTPGTQVRIITSLLVGFSSVSCLNAFLLLQF